MSGVRQGFGGSRPLCAPAGPEETASGAAPGADLWRQAWISLPAQGSFSAVPLHRVLMHAHATRQSGALELVGGRKRKVIYLGNGAPLMVASNLVTETLGALLVRTGKISEELRKHSLDLMRERQQRQGEVLVELRALSPRELEVALRWQAETKLLEIFGWTSGDYRFDGGVSIAGLPALGLSTPALVLRGLRKFLDDTLVEQAVSRWLDRVPRPAARFGTVEARRAMLAELELPPPEQRLLETLEQRPLSLRELYPMSTLTRVATSRLFYVLGEVGLFEFAAAEEHRRDAELSQEALEAHWRRLQVGNAFDALGVHAIALEDEIEAGYRRERERYDPSRFPVPPAAPVADLIARIGARVDQAYAQLGDPSTRARLRAESVDPERLQLFADLQFRKGEVALFWKGQPDVAERLFCSAAELAPRNGGIRAHWGLAMTRRAHGNTPADVRAGVALIEEGIHLSPRSARTYLCMAVHLRDIGNGAAARQFFQRAAQCPEDREAIEGFVNKLGGEEVTS